MAGSCSGIQDKWGMLPPGDSVDLGSEQGLPCPIFAPRPSPSPPNSQHSTNPANQKRILILEAKRVHASSSQIWPGDARPCAPGLLALPRARGPFPRATELLCDVGGYCWQQVEEGGACGSDPSGGKPDRTKKGKRKMKSQQCPNLVFH